MKHILSFDIEDWYHPEAVKELFPFDKWDNLENRVVENTENILEILQKYKVQATFFILGWIAEKNPALVKRIDDEGHEVASHGYRHRMVTQMTPEQFEEDLVKSIEVLEGITGKKVIGFRAPTFSITKKTLWALPIMAEYGILYDSSVYPIIHDRYGIKDAPRTEYVIYQKNNHEIIEFPMSTIRLGKYNFPFGGGGYFRIYPLALTDHLISRLTAKKMRSIIYAHPWEFDTRQPKLDLKPIQKLRHYLNIRQNMSKLENLLKKYEFTNFRSILS